MEIKQTSKANRNFHESYAPGEVKPPSPRSTGFVFVGVAVIVAVLFRHNPLIAGIALGVAVILLALSLVSPRVLQPLNIVWFQIGMLMHRVVNPLVMFLMFAVAMVPAGLLMRIGHDPLRSKREPDAETYWIEPDAAEAKLSSMKNQF
jgi:hypothetical protein